MNEPQSGKKRSVDLLLAFLLPAAIFLVTLLRYRIVPFGGTTLLFSDLDSQYIEFMAEYRRILLGQGSLFYSWNAGLGMNFFALTAYYLASPFNFLLVLFSENHLPLAVSLITVLKLGCAGAAFAFFLRERSGGKTGLLPLFGACYALNAWAVGYAFNIMWLDALIWLPLLCAGTDALLRDSRHAMGKLIPLFALSFISQFYMAWMTGLFCALYFLTQLIIRRAPLRKWIRDGIRFGISAGTAAGLSAFLLLPTWFVLKNNMGLAGQEFPPASGAFSFPALFGKLMIGSFDGVKDCLPHIYCGLPAIIGLGLFFTRRSIPLREKAVAALACAALLFSFWFRPLDFVWHAMDHPSWFPYRYAFLFSFTALSCAYRGFSETGRGRAWALCCLVPLLLPGAAVLSGNRPDLPVLLAGICFPAAYALSGALLSGRKRGAVLTAVCAAELLVNCLLTIGTFAGRYTKLSDYQSFHEHYRSLTETVRPAGTDFYRMEKTAFRNYNDPLGIGFPGVSHFSSTASTRQAEFLKRLGFNCYATWCTYQGATEVSDALLRIRYEFAERGKTGNTAAGPETWEHTAVFPLFFFAEDSFARYDFFGSGTTAVPLQNDLLRLLEGPDAEDRFQPLPVETVRLVNLEQGDDGIFRRIEPAGEARIDLEVRTAPDRSSYLFISEASLNYNVTVNGTPVISAARDYAPFPICLDPYAPEGGTVQVSVETVTGTIEGEFLAWELDPERLNALAERLRSEAPKAEMTGPVSFRIRTEASDTDRLIVSSIPFDAGWSVTAEGKTLPLKAVHESVLGFILPAGSQTAEISFRPYGWNYGLILTAAAALLYLVISLWETRNRKSA